MDKRSIKTHYVRIRVKIMVTAINQQFLKMKKGRCEDVCIKNLPVLFGNYTVQSLS